MPVRGRPAKDPDQRVNRVPLQHQFAQVLDVPYVPTPDQVRCPVKNPLAPTKRWWAMISTMPHCINWREGEWEYARASAVIHDAFTRGRVTLSKTLHDRERVMGTTEDARRALKIRYVTAVETETPTQDDAPKAPIAFDAKRRERLLMEEE